MAYINDLFKILISNAPTYGVAWSKQYKIFVEEIQKVKTKIENDEKIKIEEKLLYSDLKAFNDYETFLKKLFYDNQNGISSRGRSILSREKLKIAIDDDRLKELMREMIKKVTADNFTRLGDWWTSTFKSNNPLLINRAFAACSPQTLTSTVDDTKFWSVVKFLNMECGLDLQEKGSWFDINEKVTSWLDKQLKTELADYPTNLDQHIWRNIFFWRLSEYDPLSFQFKKQLVKYGAPGTGKTYTCKRDVRNHFMLWKNLYHNQYQKNVDEHLTITQFHPSFTYEDFIEGIRPIVKDGKTELRLVNGVFKTFCKQASEWEMDVYKQIPHIKEEKWSKLTVQDVKDKLKGNKWDFLSGIKDSKTTPLDKVIPPYYIIIDEINRAELSRVLGELMYCLEYRGYEGKIKTQYSELVENDKSATSYWFENGNNYFFIPNNVFILGTMNNIDRSVESFDFALRRRFQWIEVEPDYDLLIDDLPPELEPIVENLQELNKKISEDVLLGKDYRIGHSYFMNRPDFINKLSLTEFKNYFWEQNIKPLLEEYLRGSGENSRLKELKNIFNH